MMNHMKEALRRRRGKGVDISIVLGDPANVHSPMHGDQKQVDEDAELAPETENESADVKDNEIEGKPGMELGDAVHGMDPEHQDEAQDMSLLAKVLGKSSLLARHMKK